MKQYYESEVLFQLMEREGFNIPSSVPPYESEIKAYLINQVKQAYPKLTDYEAEWLLYNYTKHLPAEFPISSVSDVTEATFENVVPFAYQSAILSGQTLVNALQEPKDFLDKSYSGISYYSREYKTPTLKANTKYYYKVLNMPTNANWLLCDVSNTSNIYFNYGDTNNTSGEITLNDKVVSSTNLWIRFLNGETSTVGILNKIQIVFIEYNEGMENWDIPYFQGMQSVKMPVLKTTGKNLFNIKDNTHVLTKLENGNYNVSAGICLNLPKFKEKTSYTLSFSVSENHDVTYQFPRIRYSDNTELISYRPNGTFNGNPAYILKSDSTKTISYIDFSYGNNDVYLEFVDFQVEEGSNSTSYEPHKSNILTVNEEVELRGIGDVRDELDCLTGEVTQRIEEVTFNSSNGWISNNSTFNTVYEFKYPLQRKGKNGIVISNNFVQGYDGDCERVNIYTHSDTTHLFLCIDKSKLSSNSIDALNDYLQSNPITAQYRLETESIKTVDLTTVNENGEITYFMPLEGMMNVQSSGEIIQPTFDMSVPVEATTQNLASFIDLEMEE